MKWSVIRDPTIVVTSLVYGVLLSICAAGGFFALWFAVYLLTSVWRYSYALLRAVAQGQRHIPAPDVDHFNLLGEWAVFWHFIAFPALIIATAPYQPLGLIVAVTAAIVFPASAALMVITSSLSQAFNPRALLEFARTVGRDYPALVFANFAVFVGSSLLIAVVLPVFGLLSSILGAAVAVWGLFASFALIGTVLRAHRTEFEIAGEVKPRDETVLAEQHRKRQTLLDSAYVSFRSGLDFAGYRTLHEIVEANGDSLEVHHWLVENMLEWQEKRYALEVAAKLIARLLDSGDGSGALALYHRGRRHDPDFRLPPTEAQQLAAVAEGFGQTGVVAELGYNREPP